MSASPLMPAAFLGHGSPMNALERNRYTEAWRAFGVGLVISFVAALFYVAAWELGQATMITVFAGSYADSVSAAQKAKGIDPAALAKLTADMDAFKVQYADPMFRLPMTFLEIFPVGLLVSLVSALVLRNPRVLPAR